MKIKPTRNINVIPPYMLDPALCKTPCYKTTHNTDYKKYIGNRLYSHIKSKYKSVVDEQDEQTRRIIK